MTNEDTLDLQDKEETEAWLKDLAKGTLKRRVAKPVVVEPKTISERMWTFVKDLGFIIIGLFVVVVGGLIAVEVVKGIAMGPGNSVVEYEDYREPVFVN